MRLQYEQEHFQFLKDLIKRTPYAKHLAEEDVCNLVDAVVIKEYVDGSFILNECSNQDECFTVVRGCAVRVKASLTDTGDYEEKQVSCARILDLLESRKTNMLNRMSEIRRGTDFCRNGSRGRDCNGKHL